MSAILPLVELEGPPRERGLALGRAVGDRILATARMYAEAFRMTPDELESVAEPDKDREIIDVSDYQPPRIPSKSWRSPR
jgi:hypothetical protein